MNASATAFVTTIDLIVTMIEIGYAWVSIVAGP
jgi:hypothetical protein